MIPLRMVTACVGFDDLLAITLPRNARHFTEVFVVTTPTDVRTIAAAATVPSCTVLTTDAFTRHGANFNKGLALEWAFDVVERRGWLAVLDADVLLPNVLTGLDGVASGKLWSAPRRLLDDPRTWTPTFQWQRCKVAVEASQNRVFPGYFHLFHADDPHLEPPPWYDVTFAHAGGGDGFFQSRWPGRDKVRLPFEVLHLGPRDVNWCGRASARVDGGRPDADHGEMVKLHEGWRRERNLPEHMRYGNRVDVPGATARPWVHNRDE